MFKEENIRMKFENLNNLTLEENLELGREETALIIHSALLFEQLVSENLYSVEPAVPITCLEVDNALNKTSFAFPEDRIESFKRARDEYQLILNDAERSLYEEFEYEDEEATERALEVFTSYILEDPITAFLETNKELIKTGTGLLSVDEKDVIKLMNRIKVLKNDANSFPIKRFLYNHCIKIYI